MADLNMGKLMEAFGEKYAPIYSEEFRHHRCHVRPGATHRDGHFIGIGMESNWVVKCSCGGGTQISTSDREYAIGEAHRHINRAKQMFEEGVNRASLIYSVNWSLRGGYLPESSPYLTTGYEAAIDYMIEEIAGPNGRIDFYYQGLPQLWLDVLSAVGDENTEYAFRVAEVMFKNDVIDDEYIVDSIKHIVEAQNCVEELTKLREDGYRSLWDGHIENTHFWIDTSDRSANDIPFDLEGDDLEEMLNELNEEGW